MRLSSIYLRKQMDGARCPPKNALLATFSKIGPLKSPIVPDISGQIFVILLCQISSLSTLIRWFSLNFAMAHLADRLMDGTAYFVPPENPVCNVDVQFSLINKTSCMLYYCTNFDRHLSQSDVTATS